MQRSPRTFAIFALLGSILGLTFAAFSTVDYAEHLDRRLHDVHCSLIPGLTSGADEENPCRAAMYSAYSALFREEYWGGIPISLFALGAFSFFLAYAIYLLVAGDSASRKALGFFALLATAPLLVSAVMFYISITKVGSLCKTCVGIYLSSLLLALGALLAYRSLQNPLIERPAGKWGPAVLSLFGLAASTLIPSWVYAAAVPDERPYLRSCGKLEKPVEAHNALIRMRTSLSVRPAILFEDPLCPTCRAFHQRMVAEGAFDRLDVQLALFPLDSDCNWMLTNPLHPGACTVSKAVVCGADQARHVLEWAYEQQDELVKAAKVGEAQLRAMIGRRWGSPMLSCMDGAQAKLKLNHELHFAADNGIPVSTPQMYLGDAKVCDEDTDLGLRYTLGQLAPEVVR